MNDASRITACLASPEDLQATVDALEAVGFDRAQFGVIGLKSLFEDFAGNGMGVADDATEDAIREPESAGALRGMLIGGLIYAGAIVAAGSVIFAGGGLGIALVAIIASGGAGGLLGGLVANGFEQTYAEAVEHQVKQGELVLWISPRDDGQRKSAEAELALVGASVVSIEPTLHAG